MSVTVHWKSGLPKKAKNVSKYVSDIVFKVVQATAKYEGLARCKCIPGDFTQNHKSCRFKAVMPQDRYSTYVHTDDKDNEDNVAVLQSLERDPVPFEGDAAIEVAQGEAPHFVVIKFNGSVAVGGGGAGGGGKGAGGAVAAGNDGPRNSRRANSGGGGSGSGTGAASLRSQRSGSGSDAKGSAKAKKGKRHSKIGKKGSISAGWDNNGNNAANNNSSNSNAVPGKSASGDGKQSAKRSGKGKQRSDSIVDDDNDSRDSSVQSHRQRMGSGDRRWSSSRNSSTESLDSTFDSTMGGSGHVPKRLSSEAAMSAAGSSDVGRTPSEEAANQRAIQVSIVTTHKSHLPIANRSLQNRLGRLGRKFKPVPVSQHHNRRFHAKDPTVKAAADSFITATEDLARHSIAQLHDCEAKLARVESEDTEDREELIVMYETGLVGWIDCLFSILENANGLLRTETIAAMLMELIEIWADVSKAAQQRVGFVSDSWEKDSVYRTHLEVVQRLRSNGARCLNQMLVVHGHRKLPVSQMAKIRKLILAGSAVPVKPARSRERIGSGDGGSMMNPLGPARSGSRDRTGSGTSGGNDGGGAGSDGGSANSFLPPGTGLPLIVAVQTLPADTTPTPAKSMIAIESMRHYRQLNVCERDVLELCYDGNGHLILRSKSTGVRSGPYDMCLARRFGSGTGNDAVTDGYEDAHTGCGWIPMMPGAFEAATPTVSTIDWTLSHGWFMSQHTNISHRHQVGKKAQPMMCTWFERESRETDEANATYLTHPQSPAPGVFGGGGGGEGLATGALGGGGGLAAAADLERRGGGGGGRDAEDGDWVLGRHLGSGAFGDVHQCFDRRRPGVIMAVKQLHSQHLQKQNMLDALRSEFELMNSVKHAHIIGYDSVNRGRVYMEYAAQGTLESHINGTPLDSSSIRRFTVQILLGLDHLYCNGIIHEDLKPANIYLTSDNCVKLGDFGNIQRITQATTQGGAVSGARGTPLYQAPEAIGGQKHGRTVDVWSLGCIVWEMSTGRIPYHELAKSGSQPFETGYQAMFALSMGFQGSLNSETCEVITLRPVNPSHVTEPSRTPHSKCKLCDKHDASYRCRTCEEEGRISLLCLSCNNTRHLLAHGVTNSSFQTDDDKDALPFLMKCFTRNEMRGVLSPDSKSRPTPAELLTMPFVSSSLSRTHGASCPCGCHWQPL